MPGHARHSCLLRSVLSCGQCVPAAHSTHSAVPATVLYVPSAHCLQELSPVYPGTHRQAREWLAPAALVELGGHATHTAGETAAVSTPKVSAGHCTQRPAAS